MKYTPKQYARALYDLVEDAGPEEAKRIVRSFVRVLASQNLLGSAPRIIRALEKTWYERKNIRRIDIEFASDVAPERAQNIFGSGTEIHIRKEPRLIGGVRITVDDMRVDNTIRARIDKLKEAINH